jgi:hypothetical protein
MRIALKNIPKAKVSKAEIKEATEYFLNDLIGKEKIKGLKTVEVGFRKLVCYRGGYARIRSNDNLNLKIVINSNQNKEDIFRVLAHECTHIKQYFLKELTFEHSYSNGRRRTVRVWKGKRILRSKYETRAWEVEARKYEDKGRKLYLDSIRPKKVSTIKATVEVQKPKDKSVELTNKILRAVGTGIKNGELASNVLEGNNDKQFKIKVLKAIYEMKQFGLIIEKNINGLVFVYNNG